MMEWRGKFGKGALDTLLAYFKDELNSDKVLIKEAVEHLIEWTANGYRFMYADTENLVRHELPFPPESHKITPSEAGLSTRNIFQSPVCPLPMHLWLRRSRRSRRQTSRKAPQGVTGANDRSSE